MARLHARASGTTRNESRTVHRAAKGYLCVVIGPDEKLPVTDSGVCALWCEAESGLFFCGGGGSACKEQDTSGPALKVISGETEGVRWFAARTEPHPDVTCRGRNVMQAK